MPYETRCFKIKLKPGNIDRVREWARTLNARRDEALATLRDESVVIEAVFFDRTDDGDFLITIMKAQSFEQSTQAAKTSPHPIDAYHQQFKKDVWESGAQLELLVDLDRIDELGGL